MPAAEDNRRGARRPGPTADPGARRRGHGRGRAGGAVADGCQQTWAAPSCSTPARGSPYTWSRA
eukprot:11228123-Lingulodinium_polyedra.AAC.1